MRKRRLSFAIVGSRGYPSTYGGFETFVRRLAPHLASQGVDVTVYGREARFRGHAATVNGIRVVHTPGIDRPTTSTLTYGLTSITHAAIKRHDAALVLNVANGFWLPLLRLARVPSVVNVDGIEWERDKWSRFGKAVFRTGARLTARNADQIIVDSKAIGDYWRREFAVSSHFIPYGADLSSDDASDRVTALGLEPNKYVLVVARLVPENNVELFLDALEQLDPGVQAVVVGSAAAASPLEERLATFRARRPSFYWLGHVSDQELLSQLWRHCAAYVHGHSVGGTNPALLQALAHGSPTVVLSTVYNVEVVGDDWPTFATGQPDKLAELLDNLLKNPTLQQDLRRRGKQIVATRYTWDHVLSEYATLLHTVASMRRARQVEP